MHDPKTVAFEMRSPIRRRKALFPQGYREPWLTIWHCDPQVDGDEDSCGWSMVPRTEADREWADALAKDNWGMWFSHKYSHHNMTNADNQSILWAAWVHARHRAIGHLPYNPLSVWDIIQCARLLQDPMDNMGCVIYRAHQGSSNLAELLLMALQHYKTARRPWWKHPRWHIRHWELQWHWAQKLKRWAWSRCAGCGERFAWGYSPYADSWSGQGPGWFKGEEGVWHSQCMERRNAQQKAEREQAEREAEHEILG